MTDVMTPEARDKLLAETRKLQAEAEREQVEIERLRADIAKVEAEAREAAARAEIALHRAAMDRLTREETERKTRDALASDRHHHVYRFDDEVSDDSVSKCIAALTVWHRTAPDSAWELLLTSPGGAVLPGMALYDFLRGMSRAGHHITTAAYGYAASMAGILLQAGDTRIMARESWLLIHEPSAGVIGSLGAMSDRVDWMRRLNERVTDIFYERSRQAAQPLDRDEIRRRYERKDWWLSSEEALAHGFVDEVR